MKVNSVSQVELDFFHKFLPFYLIDFLDETEGTILLWGFHKSLLNIPSIYYSRFEIFTRSDEALQESYPMFRYVKEAKGDHIEALFILSNTYFFDIEKELNEGLKNKLHYPQMVRLEKFYQREDNLIGVYSLSYQLQNDSSNQSIDLSVVKNLNLGSGKKKLEGYLGLDITSGCDYVHNLLTPLPFVDNSIENIFMSHVLEHFSKCDGLYILRESFRVLKPNGVIRISVPDFDIFVKAYLSKDYDFYCQNNGSVLGEDRFEGESLNEKFMFVATGSGHKEFYNHESMKNLFLKAGFKNPEQKEFMQGKIFNIEKLDNRPEQSLFIEAIKEL